MAGLAAEAAHSVSVHIDTRIERRHRNERRHLDNGTPLLAAAWPGHVVRTLLRLKADVGADVVAETGRNGHFTVAQLLTAATTMDATTDITSDNDRKEELEQKL
jgi:hypothetical protein